MPATGFELTMFAAIVPAACYASWHDYRHHRVPNWLNIAILLGGLSAQTYWFGWPGVQTAMLGVSVGLGSLVLFWAMNAMGAGDVKFMAAMGAWLGPQMTFHAVLAGCLLGGLIAFAMILYQRRWAQATVNVGVMLTKVSSLKTAFGEFGSVRELSDQDSVLPYAIPLSIGTLVVLVYSCSGWWGVI